MSTIISGYVAKKKGGIKLFNKNKQIENSIEEYCSSEAACVKALEQCFNPTEKRTIILLFKVYYREKKIFSLINFFIKYIFCLK